jgi:hypothetical protein
MPVLIVIGGELNRFTQAVICYKVDSLSGRFELHEIEWQKKSNFPGGKNLVPV